jgi:hypothetical protein
MVRGTAVFAVMLMAFPTAGPPIRYVPRLVDRDFSARHILCKGAPDTPGATRTNEARLSVAELLGSELVEVQLHQIGEGFADFSAAIDQVRRLLSQRPQHLSNYSPWAEATPLASHGILGTLRYTDDRSGRLEIAGVHMCLQDSTGTYWWIRLAAIDIWP